MVPLKPPSLTTCRLEYIGSLHTCSRDFIHNPMAGGTSCTKGTRADRRIPLEELEVDLSRDKFGRRDVLSVCWLQSDYRRANELDWISLRKLREKMVIQIGSGCFRYRDYGSASTVHFLWTFAPWYRVAQIIAWSRLWIIFSCSHEMEACVNG